MPIFIWKAKAFTESPSVDFALHHFREDCVTKPPVTGREAANQAFDFPVFMVDDESKVKT